MNFENTVNLGSIKRGFPQKTIRNILSLLSKIKPCRSCVKYRPNIAIAECSPLTVTKIPQKRGLLRQMFGDNPFFSGCSRELVNRNLTCTVPKNFSVAIPDIF